MFRFEFVLFPCVLALITTRYWKGFIKAFVYIFDKERRSKEAATE